MFCSQADQCRISVCYILEIQETELRKLDKSGMCVRNTSSYCFVSLYLRSYSLLPSSISLFPSLLLSFLHFNSSSAVTLIACILSIQLFDFFFTPSFFPLHLSAPPILLHSDTFIILTLNYYFFPFFLPTALYNIKTQYVQHTL